MFTLENVAPAEDPGGVKKRITRVTDDGGRSFEIAYWTKAEVKKSHQRGRIKSIKDHSGSELFFEYYEDGNLLRLTQKGAATDPSEIPVPDRSWVFTYTNPAGDAPAIGTPALRRTPDLHTPSQSTRLYSVIDPRGTDPANEQWKETIFTYLAQGDGNDRWKLGSRTDRAGAVTTYTYDSATQTTVTRPLSRKTIYTFDDDAKVTKISAVKEDSPLDTRDMLVEWTTDRHVKRVSEPGGAYTTYRYDFNGYLTEQNVLADRRAAGETDDVFHTTKLTYVYKSGGPGDVSGKWKTGRDHMHVGLLDLLTKPNGNAADANPAHFTWDFDYDAAGNVSDVKEPDKDGIDRPVTHYDYTLTAPKGDLIRVTDPNNNATQFSGHDANGFPTLVTDPLGRETKLEYFTADGLLKAVKNPLHKDYGEADEASYKTMFHYDAFHRLARQSMPKSTFYERGVLVGRARRTTRTTTSSRSRSPRTAAARSSPGRCRRSSTTRWIAGSRRRRRTTRRATRRRCSTTTPRAG